MYVKILRCMVFVGVAFPFWELSELFLPLLGDEGGEILLCCRLGRVPSIGFLIVYEPRCESVANLSTIASNSL